MMQHDENSAERGNVPYRIVARYEETIPPLPAADADAWIWRLGAKCRHADPSIFFPPRGSSLRRLEQEAKRICNACPVLAACRQYAINAGEPYGIWGGMTSRERASHAYRMQQRSHLRARQVRPAAEVT